ncbi:MAG: C25 family cysteine peptidase [Phycisphaerae bacterium]
MSKTGGAKVVTASDVDVDDDITVASGGEFEIGNNYSLIVGDVISVSGTLDVMPGATLKLTTSLTVNSGGSFEAISSASGDLCVVTTSDTATPTRYAFSIAAGATISASYVYFRYMNSTGIQITDNGSVTALTQFEYAFFDNGASGGKLLRIVNNDNVRSLNALQFFDTSSNLTYNVETSGSTAAITIVTYDSGANPTSFGGAANENDNGSGTVTPGFIIWGAVTPVRLTDARAEWARGGVDITWETSSERQSIGFRLERSIGGGPFVPIGPALIPAVGQSPDGARYQEFDRLPWVPTSVWYQLVEVPFQGPAGIVARFEAGAGGATTLAPPRASSAASTTSLVAAPAPAASSSSPVDSVIVAVPAGRVVRVSAAELAAAGFPLGNRSDRIQLRREGAVWPLEVEDGGDGSFDGIDALIWVSPDRELDRWNTEEVFVLECAASGVQPTRLEVTSTGSPGSPSALSRVGAEWRRDNASIYAPVLSAAPDRPDAWFDSALYAPALINLPIDLQAAVADSADLKIVLELLSDDLLEPIDHTVRIAFDAVPLTQVDFDGRGPREICLALPPSLVTAGMHQLSIESLDVLVPSFILLDSVTLAYSRRALAQSDRLRFCAAQRGVYALGGFGSTDLRLYQVDGPRAPRRLLGGAVTSFGSTTRLAAGIDIEDGVFEALGSAGFASATAIRPRAPSPPRAVGNDLLVIGPAAWETLVAPLLQRRLVEGWIPQYVALESVVDHCGYGRQHPEAIRRYLRESLPSAAPRAHVLLIGDATYDPRGFLAGTPPDVLPTSFVRSRDFESPSDTPYADPDDDGRIDFIVGRWPATTSAQVIAAVEKTIAQARRTPSQAAQALLVADHTADGFRVGLELLAPHLPVEKSVLLDHATWPDVPSLRQAISDEWSRSTEIVIYAGHGSRRQWSDSALVHADDAATLGVGAPVSFVIALDCLNGYFAHPASPSLAESLVLATDAGAVAFWSPSGFSSHLEQRFLAEIVLETLQREPVTIGEAILRAFEATPPPLMPRANADGWILIGDPSLRFR